MQEFSGFTSSETFTQLPDSLIDLLGEINSLAELKVALFAIWRIEHMEGHLRGIPLEDFQPDALGLDVAGVQAGLESAIQRGLLLKRQYGQTVLYFLNSPRGRLSAEAFEKGHFGAAPDARAALRRSNIFRLYEENIGPLTPLLSDMLREAEALYPAEWFEEAFEIALARNIRNWKYVEAILARWKEKGKDERKDTQSPVKNADRYSDGEFSEYIKRD